MQTTLTELRTNLYKTIDHLIETGEPIEIKRKGHILKITSEKVSSKLSNIVNRKDVISDSFDELISNNWLKTWTSGNDLS